MRKLIDRWKRLSTNEKMMVGLVIVLTIGILTRWSCFVEEVVDLWNFYFKPR